MKSFAFWYERNNNSDSNGENISESKKLQAKVHFNLFHECAWGDPFLDIGFLIENISLSKNLFFFFPFEIEEEKSTVIEDLGERLKLSGVLNAVFNENYKIIDTNIPKVFYAENSYNDGDKFAVYCLDINNDIKLQSFMGNGDKKGTIISIETSKMATAAKQMNDCCYIRFRVKKGLDTFLISEYNAPCRSLQSTFNKTYMIDFRYNNTRSLAPSLLEKMRSNNCEIVAVFTLHFLLITKAHVNVEGNVFSQARVIEQDVWKSYVAESNEKRGTADLIAYHYKDENNAGSKEKNGMYPSNFLVKLRVEKTLVPWYLLFTILLGALGSGVVELVKLAFFLAGLNVGS